VPYSLILDLFVAVLLVVTIGFAVVLNKRLGKLRKDKASLEKLAASFGDSTSRAEDGIIRLTQTTEVLQVRLDHAQALKDDLAFLIERGDRAADSLENLVRATRDISTGTSAGAASTLRPEAQPEEQVPSPPQEPLRAQADRTGAGDDMDDVKSDAERELLKAIRSAG
jgi:hypothetical protein